MTKVNSLFVDLSCRTPNCELEFICENVDSYIINHSAAWTGMPNVIGTVSCGVMISTCLPRADNETLFRTINNLKVVILTKKIQGLFTVTMLYVCIIWQNKSDYLHKQSLDR